MSKLLLHNTCRFKSHPGLTCYFNIGLIIHLFIVTNKLQFKNTSPAYRMNVALSVVTVTGTELRMPAVSRK
jgi:hypothetical protein